MFFGIEYDKLPDSIGVFPLLDVILLPRMHLSLNVFEPRYLNLVEDALQNRGLLSLVQPVSHGSDDDSVDETDGRGELHKVGSLCRLTAFQEDRNRILISLEGLCRVRFGEELSADRGYRVFTGDYRDAASDFNEESEESLTLLDRDKFIPLLSRYLKQLRIELSAEDLSHISDERLIFSVAMLSGFNSIEKQAVLECFDRQRQANMIGALMEMALTDMGSEKHGIS